MVVVVVSTLQRDCMKMFKAIVTFVSGFALACLIAAVTTGQAKAQTVGMHIGSQHFPARDFNNINPGVYYISKDGYTVGTYFNSERRQSVYAGMTWDYGRFRIQAGAITGYQGKVLPMLAPSVHLGEGFRLTALPPFGSQGSAVLHLSFETKL